MDEMDNEDQWEKATNGLECFHCGEIVWIWGDEKEKVAMIRHLQDVCPYVWRGEQLELFDE